MVTSENLGSMVTGRDGGLAVAHLIKFRRVPTRLCLAKDTARNNVSTSGTITYTSPRGSGFRIFAGLRNKGACGLMSETTRNTGIFCVGNGGVVRNRNRAAMRGAKICHVRVSFSVTSMAIERMDGVRFCFYPDNTTAFRLPCIKGNIFYNRSGVRFGRRK